LTPIIDTRYSIRRAKIYDLDKSLGEGGG
jgi:hypothetical protein